MMQSLQCDEINQCFSKSISIAIGNQRSKDLIKGQTTTTMMYVQVLQQQQITPAKSARV
jgi:hypothetical protein